MLDIKSQNNAFVTIKNQDILDMSIQRTTQCNVIIPHVCNNVNAFGAGFAGYLSSRYPHIKENFHLLGNKAKLGYVQFIQIYHNKSSDNKVIVANMIAQNGLINNENRRPLNYFALCSCMNTVKNHIYKISDIDSSSLTEIHSPKFGSGLAGGDWKFIANLIEDIWTNIPIYLYIK